MQRTKKAVALILSVILCIGLAGCTPNSTAQSFKNSAIENVDGVLNFISKKVIMQNLNGTRTADTNGVRGTYTATYNHFDGREIPFGSTAIQPVITAPLRLTYSITAESGELEIEFLQKADTYTITAQAGSSTYDFALEPGSNYIILHGENFTGSVQLEVQ